MPRPQFGVAALLATRCLRRPMSYPVNTLLRAVQPPPIAETRAWIAGRSFPPEKPLLDTAQAVPSYPPAADLREHVAAILRETGAAGYTDILGLPALREALADHLSAEYEAAIPAGRVGITAGCNQAYCLALLALAEPGDEVILPVPYYFNHHMWLEMLGLRPVFLPYDEAAGGVPDPEAAAALVTPRTRAIVLVTPNNPTGAVFPAEVIERFAAVAREAGVALVLDETYKDFRADPGPAHGLFRQPDWADTVVQLYSFSKAYALAGYRVGAITASEALLAEVAKIADCVAICAPRLSQEAALYGVRELATWREAKRATMAERVEALQAAFAAERPGYRLISVGAYFAYVRHPFVGEPAARVARRLADDQNVLCLPGSMFGPEQEPYLRFAFANLDSEHFEALARRLAASASG